MYLGVESFTMNKDFKEDFFGTLEKVSKLGLHYVEYLSVVNENDHGMGNGLSPKEAVKIFGDYGMELTGTIFFYPNSRESLNNFDEMQKVIDWWAEAGASAVGLGGDYFVDAEFLKRRMDTYNELGHRCQKAGMSWIYHNHFHELQKVGDKTVLQLMCEYTDPECVGFDWDVYWGLRGLVDPVENIKTLGKRIKRFHCKDFPFNRLDHINIRKDLPDDELISWDNKDKFSAYKMVVPEDFIECGKGIIKWQDVINEANKFDIPYMFVEQDYTTYPDKYQSLAVSRDYLLSLNGISVK